MNDTSRLDEIDRRIVNRLQIGLPICDEPYREVAEELGLVERELIERLEALIDDRVLTRFGPLYDAERLGGALSLCAMKVPEEAFERVAEQVNGFPEVAHNYRREHAFNMWFVVATETPERKDEVLRRIEQSTGYRVFDLPKEKEYYVGLHLAV